MSDRRHTPEAQSRVTVPTVRVQRESSAGALDPSPSTTSSAVGLGTGGLTSTSSLQNVPVYSALIESVSSLITMLEEREVQQFTQLQQLRSFGRSGPGENVFYCPICFENIKNTGGQIVALPCGHMFCRQCLFTFFERKKQCPLCQAIYNEFPNILEVFM